MSLLTAQILTYVGRQGRQPRLGAARGGGAGPAETDDESIPPVPAPGDVDDAPGGAAERASSGGGAAQRAAHGDVWDLVKRR